MASLDALNALHQMKQKLKGQLVNAWSSGHGFRRCVANRCRFGRAPANRTVAAAFSPPSFGFMLSSRSERLSASRGTSLRFCFAASGPAFSRALKASISLGRSRIRVLASLLSIALAFLLAPASRGQSKRASNPDTECLSCHAQPDLKSASGHSVFVNAAKHQASVHAILNCTSCHTDVSGFPHTARIKKVDCAACHSDEAASVPASIHAVLGAQSCTDCHGSAHDTRSALSLLPQICNSCHTAEVKDFLASAHGAARKAGDPRSPTCETCHGSIHKIVSASDQASPVAKKNQPATCGGCHADPAFLASHQIPFAHPVESYQASVHGRAVAAGNNNAAACSDCHSAHAIYPAQNARSTINHWNVPGTCATCHAEIAKTYRASVHGQAVAYGVFDAPVCTDCHGDHAILAPQDPGSLVNPARVSLVTCGRCHGDARLEARYNLPADRVPTFANSFHGLAARAGSQSVANCASCHGVHNIFRSSDPRSTVNTANLSRTCGACHTGAGKTFAIGPVHVDSNPRNEEAAVRLIRQSYWVLIPLTIGFMFFHHGLDFWKKFRSNHVRTSGEKIPRMNIHFRIAHWLTVVSFPALVITGFALKYPESWWARPMLIGEGRFAFRGTVHRIAAIVLLASVAYHVAHLVIRRRDRAYWREMLPNLDDMSNLTGALRYNLGYPKRARCSDASATWRKSNTWPSCGARW